MIRCSRPMSWADARPLPSGGRRSAQRLPAASATPYVRFDRPPAIRSNASGSSAPSTFASNQRSTPALSMPSGTVAVASSSAMAAKALIVDFGGVLTTSIWPAFSSFCEGEGLDPDAVRDLFRGDAEALRLLRGLETGELAEAEFEPRFGALLGVAETEGLIDRLFAGLRPDEAMIAAVRAASTAGVRTGLVSNSWGFGIY